MTKKHKGKIVLASVVIACVCAACISVPTAFGFWMVHGEDHTEAESTGAVEINCTVDETAVGGGVYTDLIFVPTNSTAEACLTEFIFSTNEHYNPATIHDHSYSNLGEYLQGKNYTVTVYDAASQKPGTQTTYDTAGTTGINTSLNRYDCVVFRIQP